MDLKGDKDENRRLMTNENEMPTGGLKTLATSGKKFSSHPLIVHSLVVIFGISAWIGVNGIYVQLPLLVTSAPEGWNLAAYLVVIIQAANVGPAIYAIAKKYSHPNESLCIFFLLLAGSSSMGLLAFFYQKTFYLGNAKHSLTLFISGFFTALVGCTSSVLFMPYLRNSREKYLVSYFIGEGLSGVLPSVVALFQGVGGNRECVDTGNGTRIEISPEPRFSSRSYFIFIFTILLLSLFSFGLLRYLLSAETKNSERKCDGSSSRMGINGQPEARENGPRLESGYGGNDNDNRTMKRGNVEGSNGSSRLMANNKDTTEGSKGSTNLMTINGQPEANEIGSNNNDTTLNGSPSLMAINGQPEANEIGPRLETINGYGSNLNVNDITTGNRANTEIIDNISSARTIYLHILVGLVCFLGNGFLPGIQTYSCLPYGNVAFHMTVTLANIANPTACLLFLWLDSGNLRILDALTFVEVTSCTYAIYLAAMSPVPPLRDSAFGVVFAVLTWVFLTGIISYLKLFVTSSVRRKLGPNALLGVGIVMQLGSACGALLSFGLINYTKLFRQNVTCAPL